MLPGLEPLPQRKPAKDGRPGLLAEAEDRRPGDDDQPEGAAQEARLGGSPEPGQPGQGEAAGRIPFTIFVFEDCWALLSKTFFVVPACH